MIKLIAAVGAKGELGKRNDLIWHLKGDMAFFRTHTIGHIVVMGANTFKSLPQKLPNRMHYVLTGGSSKNNGEDNVKIFDNLGQLLAEIKHKAEKQDVYVIGGASVYSLFIELADELLLTEIDATDEHADAYFPKMDKTQFTRHVIASNEENGIKYTHVRYVRK